MCLTDSELTSFEKGIAIQETGTIYFNFKTKINARPKNPKFGIEDHDELSSNIVPGILHAFIRILI